MRILYRDHAVTRMLERAISPAMVEQIILKPEGKIKQSKDKWILFKRFRERKDNLIAAVTLELAQNQNYEVITVMVNFEVSP